MHKEFRNVVLVKLLREIYLAGDSIVLYITPIEIKALLRKLPFAFSERETQTAEDYFACTLQALGIPQGNLNMDVIAHLMDSLAFIASSKDGRAQSADSQIAMELMTGAIADYLMGAYVPKGGLK